MTSSRLGMARLLLVACASLLGACLSHTRGDDAGSIEGDAAVVCVCIDAGPPPVDSGAVDSGPVPDVDAALSSVTLADDCPEDFDGDCAIGGCPCQQTSLQLRFTAGAIGAEVPIELVSVSLLTEEGVFLQSLTSRDPRTFVEGSYVAWDETIAAAEDLAVAYDATAPDWSVVDPTHRFGTRYTVRVVVRIGGVERTLELSPVMRQSDIDT